MSDIRDEYVPTTVEEVQSPSTSNGSASFIDASEARNTYSNTSGNISAFTPSTESPASIITRQTKDYYSTLGNIASNNTSSDGITSGIQSGILSALPSGFKTDVAQIANFQLGSFLDRHGVVNGSTASVINGIIDFIKAGGSTKSDSVINNVNFNINSTFIPIVIETEFNLGNSGTSKLYILFQSTPDNISFSKQASWNPKEFYGRPEPVQIFSSSGAVTFALTGRFFADSPSSLSNNMDLEKQLFALVTPSRNHFMPSPVKVKIGEWKILRCITNSITIDFQGPWYIPKGVSLDSTSSQAEILLNSHSPYIYDVTFNFTITSKENSVQYAEDLVDYGFNGGYPSTSASPLYSNTSIDTTIKYSPTVFASNPTTTYNPETGELTYSVAGQAGGPGTTAGQIGQFSTINYLQNLGLPTSANNAMTQAANGEITSGLSAIIQNTITKNYGPQITRVLGK